MSAPISWRSNEFHEISTEYTTGDCELYVDGAMVASGNGVEYVPKRSTWTNGWYLGANTLGYEQMRGAVLELFTWSEELGAGYTNDWLAISNEIAGWQYAEHGGFGGGMTMGMAGGVLTSGGSGTNGITGNSGDLTTQTSQRAGTGPNATTTAATTPEQIAAIQAARAAADAAYFSNNIAPYLVPDLGITSDAMKRQIVTNLLILSSNLNSMQTAQHAAVSNLLRRQAIPMPQSWVDAKGNSCYFDHMNADGSPAIKVTQGIESVETVGAQNLWPTDLWPGASTGFGLTGSNVLLAQWDAGDVLTTHREFTTNGNSRASVYTHYYYGIDAHATFVAGIMIAAGVDPNAKGFAPQAGSSNLITPTT